MTTTAANTTYPPAIVATAEAAPERHGTCSVYFRINDTLYAARCMRTAAGKLWRLRKPDGQSYDVHRGAHGLECTCWDWIAIWANRAGDGCKHCKALQTAGLLD
jgi:hypothetical protein